MLNPLSRATTQGICSEPQLKEHQQANLRDITKAKHNAL